MERDVENGYLLLVDAATEQCSAAIAKASGNVIAEMVIWERNKQSQYLAPTVEHLLTLLPLGSRITGVAVTSGPGSYTGLRIGASYVKGLCYAQSLPLYVVPTTEVMVQNLLSDYPDLPEDALLMPMVDARRMEVYGALYDRFGEPLSQIDAWVLTEEQFQQKLRSLVGDRPLYYFGPGAAKAEALFSSLLSSSTLINGNYPRASGLLAPVLRQIEEGACVDLAYWEPFYLKEYQATVGKNRLFD